MSKKKAFTLTHTEILCLAIRTAAEEWKRERDRIEAMQKIDSSFAATMKEDALWENKLRKLLELYKLETGSDYGFDFGLEGSDEE